MRKTTLLKKLLMLGRANVLITINRVPARMKRDTAGTSEAWRDYIEIN